MSDELSEGATTVMSVAELMQRGPKPLLLMVDKQQIFRLPLSKDDNVVGRAVECDVKIDFADVSRRHCRIKQDGSGFIIEDLGSSGGTFLASEGLPERPVKGKTALADHDVIRVGAHRFHFVVAEAPKPEDLPQLLPLAGGPVVQLTGAVSTVGRSGANVTVSDPRVSSKHAIIEVFGKDSVYVIDQGSANGTTVNDRPVAGLHRLQEHDVVAFAGIKYRLLWAGGQAKTMIGVVSAPASERAVVGTGTLRFDEERRQVIAALADDSQNFKETLAIHARATGVGKKPELAGIRLTRATTGTYTGPHPLDQVYSGPEWLRQLKRRLQEPGGTMAVRIGGGVVALLLLLYPYVLTVTGECRLAPGTVQKVRAPMQGRIEKVMVVEGQYVHKGDVLLRFADRELQYELRKAQDRKGTREVDRINAQLELTVVRAGIDGKVVTQSPQDLTNVVVATGQELLEIDETRRIVAEVLVPEGDIGDVAIGQKVYARVYTDTTETYESEVQTIMPVAEKGVLGSVVVVKAPIANEDERLIPGTTGVAKIVGKRHLGVVLLLKKIARMLK